MIGKRVIAKVLNTARNNDGKLIPGILTTVGGIVDYVGPNKHLNIPLIVVINRTPYEIRSIKDIEVITK